jgi:hypothetical protein
MSLAIRRRFRTRRVVRAAAVGFAALILLTGAAGAAGDNGLIDDERYESPSYGYEVEWNSRWDAQSEMTTSEDGADTLALCHAESCLAVNGTANGLTPDDLVDLFIEGYEEDLLSDVEVFAQDREDGISYATFSGKAGNGSRWVIHVEARLLEPATDDAGPVLLYSFLTSPAADYEQAAASAARDVELDGAPVLLFADAVAEDDRDDEDSDRRRDDDREEERDDHD